MPARQKTVVIWFFYYHPHPPVGPGRNPLPAPQSPERSCFGRQGENFGPNGHNRTWYWTPPRFMSFPKLKTLYFPPVLLIAKCPSRETALSVDLSVIDPGQGWVPFCFIFVSFQTRSSPKDAWAGRTLTGRFREKSWNALFFWPKPRKPPRNNSPCRDFSGKPALLFLRYGGCFSTRFCPSGPRLGGFCAPPPAKLFGNKEPQLENMSPPFFFPS